MISYNIVAIFIYLLFFFLLSSQEIVPDNAITNAGRLVQCSSCGNKWTQFPVIEKTAKKPKNLHIVYEGVITPWIIASDLYFHSGCTSFTEAACLRKKIVCFISGKSPPKFEKFKHTGYFFSDYKKCLNFINSRISRDKFNFKRYKI